MKKNTFMIVAGIVAGLIIGFLVGITVDFPKVDQEELTGTIRKVDNYRNAKASEADIQLQNDLVSDTVTLKMLKTYITYHYLDAIKMAGDIGKAVTQANAVEAFKDKEAKPIESLSSYGTYLASTRGYFLVALVAISDPKGTDPSLIRNSLNQVNNVIAQKNYRSRTVVDFITQAESFLASNKSADFEGLRQAHDLLALDMVNASVVTNDKVMQKFLGKRPLLSDVRKLSRYDHAATMQQVRQDVEQMGYVFESEKLGSWDAEKMGFVGESEKLGALDAEKLGIFDAEKMGFLDAEKMGVIVLDAEKLGFYLDAEKMGEVMDAEKMGTYMDAEKMGTILDAEKMGQFMDADKLGTILDADKLGSIR